MKNDFAFAKTRQFAPLFGTQFLGAFNDNLFKNSLFALISFYGLGKNDWLPPEQMLNLGALLFVLPYFLFSTLAGQLATRFDKARLSKCLKWRLWRWPAGAFSLRPRRCCCCACS